MARISCTRAPEHCLCVSLTRERWEEMSTTAAWRRSNNLHQATRFIRSSSVKLFDLFLIPTSSDDFYACAISVPLLVRRSRSRLIGSVRLIWIRIAHDKYKFNLRFNSPTSHIYFVSFFLCINISHLCQPCKLQLRRPFFRMCIRWNRRPTIFQWQISDFFLLFAKWCGMCSNLAARIMTDVGEGTGNVPQKPIGTKELTAKGIRQTSL